MKKFKFVIAYLFLGLLTLACTSDADSLMTADDTSAASTLKKTPAIWADCEQFATKGTTSSFKPTAGPFDELYKIGDRAAISDSKPGDKDFNGGRWHVNVLKEGIDPATYPLSCSVDDLNLDDFMSTDVYFECPLIPIRGNSGE